VNEGQAVKLLFRTLKVMAKAAGSLSCNFEGQRRSGRLDHMTICGNQNVTYIYVYM